MLVVYELARRMFGRGTGLLAGLIIASVAQFAMLIHAATPDATLLAFTVLSYFAFWVGHRQGCRNWWHWMAAANALAFLTKGPIGLAMPTLVVGLYFAWNRELRRFLDVRMVSATLLFLLIAAPWYTLVSTETHGEWLRVFWNKENLERFTSPMDRHNGSIGYYFLIVLLMFAPWSAFLLPLFWVGIRGAKRAGEDRPFAERKATLGSETDATTTMRSGSRQTAEPCYGSLATSAPHVDTPSELSTTVRANRFLLCWIVGYFVFFSAAATKLPNYMLPIYPAMAILTARYLAGWRDGLLAVPRWIPAATVAAIALVGVGTVVCVLLGARVFPELTPWCALGLIPLAGALWMGMCLRSGNRSGVVTAVTVTSVVFMGVTVAFPLMVLEPYKAPKELVRECGVDDPNRDIRLGQFEWLLPSVVYYAGREVKPVLSEEKVVEFLAEPTPAYLFIMEETWNTRLARKVAVPWRVAARHYDFLDKGTILVVTNEVGNVASR